MEAKKGLPDYFLPIVGNPADGTPAGQQMVIRRWQRHLLPILFIGASLCCADGARATRLAQCCATAATSLRVSRFGGRLRCFCCGQTMPVAAVLDPGLKIWIWWAKDGQADMQAATEPGKKQEEIMVENPRPASKSETTSVEHCWI